MASTSFHLTVSPACLPRQLVVVNGDFESGTMAPWAATDPSSVTYAQDGHDANAGAWKLDLNKPGLPFIPPPQTQIVQQSIDIPDNCSAKLSFYLYIETSEVASDNDDPYDKLAVRVNGANEFVFSSADKGPGYVHYSVSLGQLTGSALLSFTTYADPGERTWFLIDDVTITVS